MDAILAALVALMALAAAMAAVLSTLSKAAIFALLAIAPCVYRYRKRIYVIVKTLPRDLKWVPSYLLSSAAMWKLVDESQWDAILSLYFYTCLEYLLYLLLPSRVFFVHNLSFHEPDRNVNEWWTHRYAVFIIGHLTDLVRWPLNLCTFLATY